MKKIVIYFILLMLSLCSCTNEERLVITESLNPEGVYDTLSTDPVKRYEANYYYNYGRVFTTDPEPSDYIYNFQYKNKVRMVKPQRSQEHLMQGIRLMEELFMNFYPDDFIRNHFYHTLIVADSIISIGDNRALQWYMARSCAALTIDENSKSYTEEQRRNISLEMQVQFLLEKLYRYDAVLNVDQFFKIGDGLYGVTADKKYTQEELYAVGFLKSSSYGRVTVFADKYNHLSNWLYFIFKQQYTKGGSAISKEEFEKALNTHQAMKQKMKFLTEAIETCIGLESYEELIYKTK